jgi:hypothetical protein
MMLPLGLMLLADDIPPLRRARGRALGWVARRRPHWLAGVAGRPELARPAAEKSGDSPEPPYPAGD